MKSGDGIMRPKEITKFLDDYVIGQDHAKKVRPRSLTITQPPMPPPKGWIRAIRDAVGMTGGQLASRLGIRPQTVAALEKSEAAGSIQLSTLRRVAEAMDCTLVYAKMVPTSAFGM